MFVISLSLAALRGIKIAAQELGHCCSLLRTGDKEPLLLLCSLKCRKRIGWRDDVVIIITPGGFARGRQLEGRVSPVEVIQSCD